MESSGETPQKAAVDDKDQIAFCSGNTNPHKLPQLRSLNPRGMREVETTHPIFSSTIQVVVEE